MTYAVSVALCYDTWSDEGYGVDAIRAAYLANRAVGKVVMAFAEARR